MVQSTQQQVLVTLNNMLGVKASCMLTPSYHVCNAWSAFLGWLGARAFVRVFLLCLFVEAACHTRQYNTLLQVLFVCIVSPVLLCRWLFWGC